MTTTPPPGSHSHFAAFHQCPHKYWHYYVLRDVPWETSPEMSKGKQAHEAMQQRIEGGWLSENGYQCKAEVKLGITQAGTPCDFFSGNVYFRGVVDVLATREDQPRVAVLLDWKTGKRREDPTELRLHGLLVRAHWPKLDTLTGHYVWLADFAVGHPHDLSDTANTMANVHATFDEIGHQLAMGYMPPKQGPLCDWCRVKSCRFNPGFDSHDARRQSQNGNKRIPA